jgi:hypothetical protein
MIPYSHHIIAQGKAICEAFEMARPFSDRITHRSFFWFPTRKPQ